MAGRASIALPGVELSGPSLAPFDTMLVIGGRAPEPSWLLHASKIVGSVWAVDSGSHACRGAGVIPDVLIGDSDSSSREDVEWAASVGARMISYDRAKDLSDFQLALRECPDGSVLITGCFGGRADHLMSAIESAASCGRSPVCMADHGEGIFFLDASSGEAAVEMKFADRIKALSLLPITDVCEGVRAAGARWPLSGARLERARIWTISNEPAEDGGPMSVSCGSGTLGVYWCTDERLTR